VPPHNQRIFVDHNVSLRTVEQLRRLRYAVETAYEAGISQANDEDVLLFAAERGSVRLTHNYGDFQLLFRAWHRWSEVWGVDQNHPGIVIYPQEWSPDVAVQKLLTLFDQFEAFENCCVRLLLNGDMQYSRSVDRSTWR
jgi:hypothetical protein